MACTLWIDRSGRLLLVLACWTAITPLPAQEPAAQPPILSAEEVGEQVKLLTSIRAKLLELKPTPKFEGICAALQAGLDQAIALATDRNVETLKFHIKEQLTSVLADELSPLGPDAALSSKWTDGLNAVLAEFSQKATTFEQWVAAVNRAKGVLNEVAAVAVQPAAIAGGAPMQPLPLMPGAGPEIFPEINPGLLEQLVKDYVVNEVKEVDESFAETSSQLALRLAAIVQKYAAVPPADDAQREAIQADAQTAFSEVLSGKPIVVAKAWTLAREEFHKQLVARRVATTNTAQWRSIYDATAKGLALAAAHRQAIANEFGAGFWTKNGDLNGTTFWDERFDDSAEKLATRMVSVADNAALADSKSILTQLANEFRQFLDAIDNPQVPEKRAAWTDLIQAWREQLVAGKQAGALNAADPEVLKTAIREGAKDLRQAGTDWTEKRNAAARNTGMARTASAAAASGGAGSGYGYGYGHAAVHHARAMARIHARHSIQRARIQRFSGP